MLTLIKKETSDIVFISEIKLNYRHKVHYKNYSIIRHDRPNATQGGGTAILIKLTRNHFAQPAKIKENSVIFGCLFPNESYYKNTLTTGYIPPKHFYT